MRQEQPGEIGKASMGRKSMRMNDGQKVREGERNSMDNELRFAILIDADNVSDKYIKIILDETANNGIVTYKRIYGDWTSPNVGGWKQSLLENAVTPIQQYGYTTGTQRMSQLRFVPATGYTGSVELPYVAYDSAGKAIAAGKFCLGVVNSRKNFNDVTSSTWCYKYVMELADGKVIDGYTDGSFKPNNTITYGAALKLVMLAAGYPEQKPTGSNVFSGYLTKARAEGIITRTNVDLTKPITRLQVAQLAAGALKLDTTNLSTVQPFTDTTDASVRALNAAGSVEGYVSAGTSTYKPNNTLTRGQVSAIVWRMRNYQK